MPAHDLRLPSYSRADISIGIAHFGVGNFHRAHQAVYLHELFNRGIARDWGICGVGVLPADVRMRDALTEGDYTYTHVERLADGTVRAQKVASIVDYIFAPDDPEAALALLSSPATRIVSLTITEGGYNVSPVSGLFDAGNPAVLSDLVPGATPSTVFGLVIEGLARRRASGIPPFTVLSCDNLQGNGAVARRSFVSFASLKDPELGEWVADNVSFPNTMVDRITPATSEEDRQFVERELGVTDPWPVLSEEYLQWVIEDAFPLGRPPLELVGVEVVDDVAPFELMKLRLLNATHQALTYFGLLFGHELVDESARDPLVRHLLERYQLEEAEPTLVAIPDFDVVGYGASAIERFSNPYIRDTLARIATDASDRISTFLLPVAADAIAAGRSTPLVAGIVSSWAAYCSWSDRPMGIKDRQQAVVDHALAMEANSAGGFLRERGIFGDLADSPAFVSAFSSTLDRIARHGPRSALEHLVSADQEAQQ